MTDEERLVVLKKDLQMLTSGNDDYLKTLLGVCEECCGTRRGGYRRRN